jgi:hypothetical protein
MLTALTPVQCVANQDLRTTLTRATPTSWVDWLPECTRQSCPQRVATLHPIVDPSSSSSCSNVCPLPTTHLEAWPGSNQPSRAVWQNANGQQLLPPADNYGHAGLSARPRNDDECQAVPAKHWKRAIDADGPTADGSAHDDELLCPQPAAQPLAGVLLTSRGG